jgi:hypothetical protein
MGDIASGLILILRASFFELSSQATLEKEDTGGAIR